MPELPEVETIRRQLAPHLEGRTLERVEIEDFRWTRPVHPAEVAAGLTGRRVEQLRRHGKYLDWELDGELHLIQHLRMTGTLLFDPETEPSHTRARFWLDDGHRLLYLDQRRFGTAELLFGSPARDAYIAARLGPEPFTPAFSGAYLKRAAAGRTAPVKPFLLDQRRVAGIGNIYADEALFRARIHPLRAAGSLTRAQMDALAATVEESLAAGIAAKGASIDDFRHVDGARGAFQNQFLVHLREGEPCVRCGTEIRKLVVGSRGTYVCESCQRRPRVAGAGTARRSAVARSGSGRERGLRARGRAQAASSAGR